jgi:hypothetical protein
MEEKRGERKDGKMGEGSKRKGRNNVKMGSS